MRGLILFGLVCMYIVGCFSSPSAPSSHPTAPTALVGGDFIDAVALKSWQDQPFLVVDLRSADSYELVQIPGALPVFFERLGPLYPGLAEHPKSIPVVVVADTDEDALRGAQMLVAAGYQAKGLAGGVGAWEAAGFPVEKKSAQ